MTAVEGSEEKQKGSPPDISVKMIEHDGILRGMRELVEAGSENQQAIYQQRDADKEPYGNGVLRVHSITRK